MLHIDQGFIQEVVVFVVDLVWGGQDGSVGVALQGGQVAWVVFFVVLPELGQPHLQGFRQLDCYLLLLLEYELIICHVLLCVGFQV